MKTIHSDSAVLSVPIPLKWRWHYQRLQSLRDALMADRASQVANIAEPLESHSMDDADYAADEYDHHLALGILSHEEDTIFELDDAIKRILDGSYGICEMTGEAIPEERLYFVPWTRYTKDALERIERQYPGGRRFLAEVTSIQGSAPGGLAMVPESEDLISTETAYRNRREVIRDLSGDVGLTTTPNPSFAP